MALLAVYQVKVDSKSGLNLDEDPDLDGTLDKLESWTSNRSWRTCW